MTAYELPEGFVLDEGRLLEAVRDLAARRSGPTAEQVLLAELLDHLLAGRAFGTPREAWRARLGLRRRVAELTRAMPGLRFVEGDA